MMLRNFFATIPLLLIFFSNLSLKAQEGLDKVFNPYPNGSGYVSNADHIIDQQTVTELNRLIKPLDKQGRAQIAVVLLNSIGNQLPKDFATALFRKWGVGSRTKNNGILILLIKDQRRVEFEVGYGLEGLLPDMTCRRIQEDLMIPYFKKGNYDTGLLKGVELVLSTIHTGVDQSLDRDNLYPETGWIVFQDILFFIVYLIVFCWYAFSERGEYVIHSASFLWLPFLIATPLLMVAILGLATAMFVTWDIFLLITYCCWSVFFSFALGKMLKHGARGSTRVEQYQTLKLVTKNSFIYTLLFPMPFLLIRYFIAKRKLRKLRYTPYESPDGIGYMTLMKENRVEELSPAEQMEEQLGSVSYDIWKSAAGTTTLKLAYPNQSNKIRRCRKCRSMTALKTKRVVEKRSSTESGGVATISYTCQLCGRVEVIKVSTSRKPKRSFFKDLKDGAYSSSGGTYSASGGGSDDSGSSSSSSGDWGGGSSGGGGSGSSW
jgi:uncharacterized protein